MRLKRILKFIVVAFILIFFLYNIVLMFRIYKHANVDESQTVDAILVLGASQWDGQPSPVFKARLDHAYDLYNQQLADKIILTGGVGKGETISEAEAGMNYLISKNILENSFILENQGHTTWQSLNNIKKLAKGINSVIFVSDGFHLMRLHKMGTDLGWEVYTSPTLYSPILRNKWVEFKYAIREIFVYWMYKIFEI